MTYEYKCDCCGRGKTIVQPLSYPLANSFAHEECPEQMGIFQLQVTGGVGTIFVGGGWTPKETA